MNDTFVSRESDRARIDPAEAGLQRELIDEVKKLESATTDIKFQNITTAPASTAIAPAEAHGCKKVRFWTAAATVSVGDADSQPVLLVQNIWNELSINNVSNLRFIGTAGTEVVYIISSN